jgi:hypothetical protein
MVNDHIDLRFSTSAVYLLAITNLIAWHPYCAGVHFQWHLKYYEVAIDI